MGQIKEQVVILQQEELCEGIYSMWVKSPTISEAAKPGQFLSLYCKNGARLLPRPISICEIDKGGQRLRVVYRVAGEGTKEFSSYKAGDTFDVMGPLGNGFCLESKKALLIGGGIGIPPMLQLAKELCCEKQMILGYRDQVFLSEEFQAFGDVYVATEDGSQGIKGNVIDVIVSNQLEADVIYACGPTPMLRAVQKYAIEHGILSYLSLEEKMACGIGVCLACVCKSKKKDEYSNVLNKRICKEGPVFQALEVEI